jgi:cytochrome c556
LYQTQVKARGRHRARAMEENGMRRTVLAGVTLFFGLGAVAAEDPLQARKELMKANGEATKAVVAIMKGAPFNLETVKTALNDYVVTSEKAPGLFPPGSDKGKTGALPAIWQNKADFDAKFAKLGADAKAALASVKDEASFKANFPPVLKNCGGCHELYRAKEK